MNCLEFRRTVHADPDASGPGLDAHAATCDACARFRRQARQLDVRLRSALEVEPPAGLSDRITYAREAASRPARVRRVALAASLVLAVLASAFALSPAPSAAAIVQHVASETLAAAPADARAPERLARRARALGGQVSGLTVLRVNFCIVGGRPLLHLVVAGENGPQDVMVAPASLVVAPTPVAAAGLRGWIAPGRRCAVAVLGPEAAPPAQRDLDRILAGVVWSEVPSGLFGQARANLSHWLWFGRFALGA